MDTLLELKYDEKEHRSRGPGVLYRAWKATKTHKLWEFVFGSIGGIIGLFTLSLKICEDDKINALILVGIFIGSAFLLTLLFYIGKYTIAWAKRTWIESKKNAELRHLRQLQQFLVNLQSCDDVPTIILQLDNMCDFLVQVFNAKTSSKCCVSIKVPQNPIGESSSWHLQNLCRDNKHKDTRDTPKYKTTDHTIINNTAYHEIVYQIYNKSKIVGYVNNDIEKSLENGTYYNSSISRSEDGKLPYKSEMVYPILIDTDPHDWRGFICVDSNEKDVFNIDGSEMEFLVSISANLYYLMKTLRNKQIELQNGK